nr:MAG TPA: hypothetical protein [Caudoviricetes sp.]
MRRWHTWQRSKRQKPRRASKNVVPFQCITGTNKSQGRRQGQSDAGIIEG